MENEKPEVKQKKSEIKQEKQKKVRKPKRNLVGQRFGKLTVISLVKIDRYTTWLCRCECGREKEVFQHNLTSGRVQSCGCVRKKLARECIEKNVHTYKGVQIEKAVAKSLSKNNTSGFRGVTLDKKSGKWRARMILQGVRHELGYFEEFEDAVNARLVAEEKKDAIVEEYRMAHN